jgi:hypothetical protein
VTVVVHGINRTLANPVEVIVNWLQVRHEFYVPKHCLLKRAHGLHQN